MSAEASEATTPPAEGTTQETSHRPYRSSRGYRHDSPRRGGPPPYRSRGYRGYRGRGGYRGYNGQSRRRETNEDGQAGVTQDDDQQQEQADQDRPPVKHDQVDEEQNGGDEDQEQKEGEEKDRPEEAEGPSGEGSRNDRNTRYYNNRNYRPHFWHRRPNPEIERLRDEVYDQRQHIRELEVQNEKLTDEAKHLADELTHSKLKQDQTDRLLKERTAELTGAQVFLGRADTISAAEVGKMVELLNVEIDQTAAIMADSLTYTKAGNDKDDQHAINIALQTLTKFVGAPLCRLLSERLIDPSKELDSLTVQVAIQATLSSACSTIISDWNPPYWDTLTHMYQVYETIKAAEGQAIAGRWRALVYIHGRTQKEDQKIHEDTMTWLCTVLTDILTCVGWSLKGPDATIPVQYREKLGDIVKLALEIQSSITKGVTSTDLEPIYVPDDTPFDSTQMENAFPDGGKEDNGDKNRLLCTIEMGLAYKTALRSDKHQVRDDSGTILKPKVVLASTFAITPQ